MNLTEMKEGVIGDEFLNVKIHDDIKPIPNFAMRPRICPSVPMDSDLEQLFRKYFKYLKN